MIEITRLGLSDYEEAIDFLNMVFSMAHAPLDFPQLLPKLYTPDERAMNCNLAVRLNGRIRAVVGLFPMDVQIAGGTMRAGGIGGVATHPHERGSGLMRHLMEAALAAMQDEGMDFSVLGGQRQRYGYYGYEKAGTKLNYRISQTNVRHFFRGQPEPAYHLVPLNQSEQAAAWLPLMQSWHDAQPFHVVRPPADFSAVLSSWRAATWVALDQDSQPAGYLVASRDGQSVSEIITASPDQLLPAAAAWVRQQSADTISFDVPAWAIDAMRQFGRISERWDASCAYNVKIINWPVFLSALLALRTSQDILPDGSLSIQITGSGEPVQLRVRVEGGQPACTLDLSAARPDLALDTATATRLLLGPLTPIQTLPEYDQLDPSVRRLAGNWFPLPFTWPSPDMV